MKEYPVQKELSSDAIEAARSSVGRLNTALRERFPNMESMKIISWMSDMHLHTELGYAEGLAPIFKDEIDTHRQFMLAMHEVHALIPTPNLLILGGDITHYGSYNEFITFDRLMQVGNWSIPTLPMFGNHENSKPPINDDIIRVWPNICRQDWPPISDSDEFYYAFSKEGIKYIVIDSLDDPECMSNRQKEWLKSELATTEQPTLVLCHRHLLPIGLGMDDYAFRNMEVWKMIDACPHVLGLFSGHTHYPKLWQYRRKFYGTFPSVALGIGANTGWGGIVLDGDRIAGVFYKELYGETFDLLNGRCQQDGQYYFMEPELFQCSVLINLWYWPWEEDPKKRD